MRHQQSETSTVMEGGMTAEDYSTPPRVVGRDAVFVRHRLKSPQVADSAYIAPTAVLCGDVTIGPHSRVLFGAVVTAEGGPVEIGANCVVMENAVIRGVPQHPTQLGDHVLVGPHASLTGCVGRATPASPPERSSSTGRASSGVRKSSSTRSST
jgi:UDP-3-O-[3-hydroxymyristoyl] glucosamine N-acyltransferase